MKFRARKTMKLGPFYWNFTQSGFSSWGVKIGRFRRNFTNRRTTIDTPGPGALHSSPKRR